jgi:Fe2+ or Zn2+ uptake regulation protein
MNLAVVETLQKKGPTADVELLSELKDSYGDLSFRELNKVLLKLEITGIVRVTRLMKGKRRIELVERREREA